MNCDECSINILAYLKGELHEAQKAALEEHLARCAGCRSALEEARRVLEWTQAASEEGIERQVNSIIEQGIQADASDIHFEPWRDGSLLVRNRVDGVLQEVTRIPSSAKAGFVTRLKMLAEMNVAESRIPQDGRIHMVLGERHYDLRVSSSPFIYGEGLVIRILDQSSVLVGLADLGLSEWHVSALRELVHQPNGLVLACGPTGSGKTTLLYSMVLEIDTDHSKVLTVEDPVEFTLNGVNQLQVNKAAGLTFTSAMRSFLRHDPDVIMCGEVRDVETARLSAEAAITGHLVLTSMHVERAIDTIQRLRDMQLPDYLIAATMNAATCQRLVRRVCDSCGEQYSPEPGEPALRLLGITEADLSTAVFRRGKGCEQCRGTGYRGRRAILEILTVSKTLRAMIGQGAGAGELMEQARADGFISMREDGRQKVLQGITTPEEAMRVLV